MDRPELPFAIHLVVSFDQELVVALVERDVNLYRLEFLSMIDHSHLLPVEVNDGPIV